MSKWPKHWYTRFLPNQIFLSKNFAATDVYEVKLWEALCRTGHIVRAQDRYQITENSTYPLESMGTDPVTSKFYAMLIRIGGYKRVLEIGTFVGASAMNFAEACGPDGHVTTVEVFSEFADIAKRNFRDNGLAERITLVSQTGMDYLQSCADGSFDFCFVDGNKENYLPLFLEAYRCTSSGGLIVVDNMTFCGDAINDEPETEKGRGVRALMDHLQEQNYGFQIMLPIVDGVVIVEKTK